MLFRFGASLPVAQLLDPALLGVYLVAALLIVLLDDRASRCRAAVHLKDAAFGALVAAFPNTGFMGVPLLVALMGPAAAGPVICRSCSSTCSSRRSLCIALAQAHESRRATGRARRSRGALRGALGNPLPWAIALGALSSASGYELLGPIAVIVKMLGRRSGAGRAVHDRRGAVACRPACAHAHAAATLTCRWR